LTNCYLRRKDPKRNAKSNKKGREKERKKKREIENERSEKDAKMLPRSANAVKRFVETPSCEWTNGM
jgi:hypothetical protein